jgi:hypothetical protein
MRNWSNFYHFLRKGKSTMEYHLVWADDNKIAYFIAEVNKKISEGWKPHGGVAVSLNIMVKVVMQAMVGKARRVAMFAAY